MTRAQEIAYLGSWELDLVNNRLSWSDEVYRIFGLEPQEFGATYDAFLEAVHPDDRAAVDAAYSGSLREGKDTYEIEHRVVRRSNGEVRIVHEKCEHVRDETGRIIKSIGMVHDVTERNKAEEALKKAYDGLELRVARADRGTAAGLRETDGGDQRTGAARSPAPPGPENGGPRHPLRGHRPRFQQYPCRDHRVYGAGQRTASHKGSRDERHLKRVMEARLEGPGTGEANAHLQQKDRAGKQAPTTEQHRQGDRQAPKGHHTDHDQHQGQYHEASRG